MSWLMGFELLSMIHILYEHPTVLRMIICWEGWHQLEDEMQLLIFTSTCGSCGIRPSGSFCIAVPVHQVNSMEDKLSTESLDALLGRVDTKNKCSQRLPPALMPIMVLDIWGDEDRRGCMMMSSYWFPCVWYVDTLKSNLNPVLTAHITSYMQ